MVLSTRDVVPYLRCGRRNQSGRTPSSEIRLTTAFEPTMAVLTAPASIRNPTTTTNAWNRSRSPNGPARFMASPEIRLS